MPTLLALCGLDIPESVDGKNVFAPDWDRDYIHGEHLYDGGSCQWIVTEKDKFIWFSSIDRKQYFDLEKDPDELHNAIADEQYQARIRELEQILIQELAWREEGYVKDGKLVPRKHWTPVLKNPKK